MWSGPTTGSSPSAVPGTSSDVVEALPRLDPDVPVTAVLGELDTPVGDGRYAHHRPQLRRRAQRRPDPVPDHPAQPASGVTRSGCRARDYSWGQVRQPSRHRSSTTSPASSWCSATGWAAHLAQEAALKCRESAGMWAEAYASGEYRHGPISVAGPGTLVWAMTPLTPKQVESIEQTGARIQHGGPEPLAELVKLQRHAVAGPPLRAATRTSPSTSPVRSSRCDGQHRVTAVGAYCYWATDRRHRHHARRLDPAHLVEAATYGLRWPRSPARRWPPVTSPNTPSNGSDSPEKGDAMTSTATTFDVETYREGRLCRPPRRPGPGAVRPGAPRVGTADRAVRQRPGAVRSPPRAGDRPPGPRAPPGHGRGHPQDRADLGHQPVLQRPGPARAGGRRGPRPSSTGRSGSSRTSSTSSSREAPPTRGTRTGPAAGAPTPTSSPPASCTSTTQTSANGCLQVIPGSHSDRTIYPFRGTGHFEVDPSSIDTDQPVPVPLQAGDMIVFDSYLLHHPTSTGAGSHGGRSSTPTTQRASAR